MKVVIKLDAILKKMKLSRREFARITGIRHPSINEMCNNQIEHLPLKNLGRICEVLDCDITDILELVPEETDKYYIIISNDGDDPSD